MQILDLNFPAQKKALDFGCGTGEFSRLLLDLGFTVYACDPFAAPKIRDNHFFYNERYEDIPLDSGSADVALSITVMGHILDEAECMQALQFIRSRLKDGGTFFVMEYMPQVKPEEGGEYQAFRTEAEWQRILRAAGFKIESIQGMPHPAFCPSSGYQKYRDHVFVRSKRFDFSFAPAKTLRRFLWGHLAARILSQFPPAPLESSPFKLMTCVASARDRGV